jgi:hypothetical protein
MEINYKMTKQVTEVGSLWKHPTVSTMLKVQRAPPPPPHTHTQTHIHAQKVMIQQITTQKAEKPLSFEYGF